MNKELQIVNTIEEKIMKRKTNCKKQDYHKELPIDPNTYAYVSALIAAERGASQPIVIKLTLINDSHI